MKDLKLVQLKSWHWKQLQEINVRSFWDSYGGGIKEETIQQHVEKVFSEKQLLIELSKQESEFYFAQLGSDVVGYCKINVGKAQTDFKDIHGLELERIYILSDYQGKNIGLQLLNKAKDIAKSLRKKYIWLGVWEKNKKGIEFYEHHGFKITGSRPFYIGKEVQKDVIMKLELD